MTTPGNELFRAVFRSPAHAAPLLRTNLPPELDGAINWRTLRWRPGTFVDEDQRHVHADLLFEARARQRPVLLYLLLLTDGPIDDRFRSCVTRYVERLLADWRREHPGEDDPRVVTRVVRIGAQPAAAAPAPLDAGSG